MDPRPVNPQVMQVSACPQGFALAKCLINGSELAVAADDTLADSFAHGAQQVGNAVMVGATDQWLHVTAAVQRPVQAAGPR